MHARVPESWYSDEVDGVAINSKFLIRRRLYFYDALVVETSFFMILALCPSFVHCFYNSTVVVRFPSSLRILSNFAHYYEFIRPLCKINLHIFYHILPSETSPVSSRLSELASASIICAIGVDASWPSWELGISIKVIRILYIIIL